MEYTNQIGLISKPLLREIVEAVRKKSGIATGIEVKTIPEKIKNIGIVEFKTETKEPSAYISIADLAPNLVTVECKIKDS